MFVDIEAIINKIDLEEEMFTTNYAESKAYQDELIRQAEGGRLLKSAKRSQKKNFSLRQIIQRIFKAQKQTVRGLEYDTL